MNRQFGNFNFDFGALSEDEDTSADCESILNSFNASKLSALDGMPMGLLGASTTNSSKACGFSTHPCLLPESSQQAKLSAASDEVSKDGKTEDDVTSDFQTPRINGVGNQAPNQQTLFGGKNGANFNFEPARPNFMPAPAKTTLHVPEPPRLGKRHDRESLGNDEFAFARKTISDWVDNESWPEDEAKPKKTRESGAISYKIQKLGSESSQGSPLTPKFGEKKLSLKKSIFQCLGDGAWEDGPMAQGCKSRTPSLGGEEMFTQLRKNTQDTIATRELSPLKEEFPTSSKKVASFFGADFRAVPFNLDDEESDGASSNGNNNPEPEPASQVKKSAKAILFNE